MENPIKMDLETPICFFLCKHCDYYSLFTNVYDYALIKQINCLSLRKGRGLRGGFWFTGHAFRIVKNAWGWTLRSDDQMKLVDLRPFTQQLANCQRLICLSPFIY